MFYETAQTIGPGWHRSYKPTHYEDMTWSPNSKHFRSPGGSPQSYRRIDHTEDSEGHNNDDHFFGGGYSPTFPRKIFRDVWDETPTSNHRFSDRPRLFKRVFKPDRWDDDDDFERTRSTVRQMARDFGPDFDTHKIDREFNSDFHHRDRDLKSDIEEELQKAAGRVHHIPIMVERRLEELRSKFGKNSPKTELSDANDESDEWQGPQVQRLKKNFERDEDYSPLHTKHRVPRVDLNKPRAFTNPIPSKWDPESVHTLPTRKSNKSSKIYEEPQATPKSVFRSYSETHEDIPKQQQQQHAAAFRSHSDGHCPKTTYVTKISVNVSPDKTNNTPMANGEIEEELGNQGSENFGDTSGDGWDSHQSRQRTRYKSQNDGKFSENTADVIRQDQKRCDQIPSDGMKQETASKSEDKPTKRTSLQQISAVLQNVDDLLVHVDAYNGTGRDKQYRFLDEMLTRCMLQLDDVDTEGREDIRSARKAAVMQVQSCIEKLESKADESERQRRREDSQATQEEREAKEGNHASSEVQCQEYQSDGSEVEQGKEEISKTESDEQTRL